MAEQPGNEGESDDILALEARDHLGSEWARQHLVEQRVIRDQERRLERLEARDAELVPGPRRDPAEVVPARADKLDRSRLDVGRAAPGGKELDTVPEPPQLALRDMS